MNRLFTISISLCALLGQAILAQDVGDRPFFHNEDVGEYSGGLPSKPPPQSSSIGQLVRRSHAIVRADVQDVDSNANAVMNRTADEVSTPATLSIKVRENILGGGGPGGTSIESSDDVVGSSSPAWSV